MNAILAVSVLAVAGSVLPDLGEDIYGERDRNTRIEIQQPAAERQPATERQSTGYGSGSMTRSGSESPRSRLNGMDRNGLDRSGLDRNAVGRRRAASMDSGEGVSDDPNARPSTRRRMALPTAPTDSILGDSLTMPTPPTNAGAGDSSSSSMRRSSFGAGGAARSGSGSSQGFGATQSMAPAQASGYRSPSALGAAFHGNAGSPSAASARPFSDYRQPQALSPYMQLYQRSSGPLDPYNAWVRPVEQQGAINQTFNSQIGGLQSTVQQHRSQLQQFQQEVPVQQGPGLANPQYFINYQQYYPGSNQTQ